MKFLLGLVPDHVQAAQHLVYISEAVLHNTLWPWALGGSSLASIARADVDQCLGGQQRSWKLHRCFVQRCWVLPKEDNLIMGFPPLERQRKVTGY